MRPALPDPDLDHDSWWHEDDVIHQAEGMLSARLAIPLRAAAALLHACGAKIGVERRELAGQVVRREVFLSERYLCSTLPNASD